MVRYLSLISFTDKGIAAIKESPQRAVQFRAQVEKAGGKIHAMYWSVGAYDGCVVFEAPDAETGGALLLGLAQLGNVRTQSMEIYDESEFKKVVDRS